MASSKLSERWATGWQRCYQMQIAGALLGCPWHQKKKVPHDPNIAATNSGMNFSLNADPEPELLLAILRQISLIENKQESRRTHRKKSWDTDPPENLLCHFVYVLFSYILPWAEWIWNDVDDVWPISMNILRMLPHLFLCSFGLFFDRFIACSTLGRMQEKFGQTMKKAMSHKMELHTKALWRLPTAAVDTFEDIWIVSCWPKNF